MSQGKTVYYSEIIQMLKVCSRKQSNENSTNDLAKLSNMKEKRKFNLN